MINFVPSAKFVVFCVMHNRNIDRNVKNTESLRGNSKVAPSNLKADAKH